MSEKFYGQLQKLREQIRDDIDLAKNPYQILLDVAETVGKITGEDNFPYEIREKINTVYSHALQDIPAMKIELDEISARRQKIQAAYDSDDFDEDEKRRIKFALDRHDTEIERLKSKL